ncbi:MAG: hypothetical protein H0W61_05465 [Bacteroidetes bacterium]|nr:hypothetical protein [Bacteroidota bacterium]
MKKLFLSAVLLSVFIFSSCKKDYVCECKKVYTGNGTTTTQDDGKYTFKDTQPRAESRCNEQEGTGTDLLGGNYSRECAIR